MNAINLDINILCNNNLGIACEFNRFLQIPYEQFKETRSEF